MDDIIQVTRHAARRSRQRGIRRRDVTRLVDLADRQVFVGSHCTSLWLSNEGVADLLGDGAPPGALVHLTRHCVLVGDNGAVLTVVAGSRSRTRRYRRTGGRR
jgi:hypothetical protein